MMSFDNTKIAFASKTDKDLKRAEMLFKMVGSPFMVKFGKTMTELAFSLGLPIRGMVKATIFRQFCGGEDIEDCSNTIEDLAKYKIGTILDYSVEGKATEEAFDACAKEVISTVHKAKGNNDIPFCVFKVTGIARFGLLEKLSKGEALTDEEKAENDRVEKRLSDICGTSFENDVRIFIDAEESWIQDAIDDMATRMMELFNKDKAIVYNTIQLYRWDRLDFLKQSHAKAQEGEYILGVKLVRGAYMEKERERAAKMGYESPIQKDKASSDKDYDLALKFCVENIERISICAGTHNENSSRYLSELMEQHNIDQKDPRVFFAQLLGMSDHISYTLTHHDFNVAKYVPYGPVKEVLPYLIRRAEENTSVKGQTGRELGLILKEKKRRRTNA